MAQEDIFLEIDDSPTWTRSDAIISLKMIANSTTNPSCALAAIKELNVMHGFNAAPEPQPEHSTIKIGRINLVGIRPNAS